MNKSMLISSIFLIASCGGGGGGGGDGKTTPSTPAPTVNLSAEPTSVLLDSASTLTWSSTNSTSCSATWTNATTGSGSEAVTINSAGNNTFSISCTGAGGAGSKSITVEGYRNIDGIVVDGYISGAEIFIDEDDDWIADLNESSTTSDNDGTFTIKYANGNLISIGGTDLDSQAPLDNLLIAHKLTAHSDFKAVTPVTSVATFMTDSSNINAALGIDSSIDIFTFDPVANRGDGGINDYLYEKGNQLTALAYALQNITNNLKSTTETTQDYFKAITEEIEKEFTETSTKVDIETESFIIKALDNVVAAKSVTISDEAEANTTKALSGIMPVIEVKSSANLTTSVIRFAVSTLQTDIKAIANGTSSPETIASYTENILSYIATDQNIDPDQIAPDISAIADAVTTSEDTAVEINVLANDSFLTSAPITVSSANGTNGSTEVLNNFITYTSDADYNGTDTFSYTITQGDKTSSADVSVTIEAVNDAPAFTSSTTFSAAENQTAIGTVAATDAEDDSVTFIVSGSELAITSAGVLTFASAPDYETKTSYTATVTASDGTKTTDQGITVSVTNVNDNDPAFTSGTTFSAAENQTSIGTVTATDGDASDTVTFIVSGSELAITSAGVLTFASAPDYETKTSYTATVTASDGTKTTDQGITVSVTNVNDNDPAFTSGTTFSAAENQTAIGTVTATDGDASDTVTFIVSGSELAITSAGVLTFASAPDYETKTSYTATVTASDGTKTTDQGITVSVTNVNDNDPAFTSGTTFSAAENQTSIGTVTATDGDASDTVTFIVSGSELAITSAGVLTFASAPDYETKTSYTATVTASDGTKTTDQGITVSVTNVNDNDPAFTSGTTFSAAENQTAIGTVTATDGDASDTVTFIVSGSELAITSAGVLTFASAPDYETKTSYTATVTASDGTKTTDQGITVSVTNVNDNDPAFTSGTTFSAAENQTSIGTVTATDGDASDTVTFIVSGSELAITSAGVLTFASAPDYETKTSYTATVTASDGTKTTTQGITVSVTDVNESPAFASSASFSAAENQTSIGTVSVSDPESQSITYSLSGTDASSLSISSSGVLTFASAPDYETKTSYTATVTASDGTKTTDQGITVSVTDVNDSPAATAASYDMNLLPQSQTSGSLTLAGTDEDGDTLTYSIVSNGSYGTASLSGSTVSYQTSASTQSAQSESFTFKVNDGTVDSSAATISIDLKTDPLYQYQWHLNNTGQTSFASNAGTAGADLNIDTVIVSGSTGEGVVVAVVDSGLEIAHEDLIDNVVSNGSWNYLNSTNDPSPTGSGSDHGTMVAGIIAAKGWNNKGGRGVAPNASLRAFNLTVNYSTVNEANALGVSPLASDVSIFNMSYGGSTYNSSPSNIYLENLAPSTQTAQLASGATTLRGGKGALYVNSSGNDYYNGDSGTGVLSYCGDGANASTYKVGCYDAVFDSVFEERYIIGVGALDADNVRAKYSTPGASLWVSAFGGDYGRDTSYGTGYVYSNSTTELAYKPAILTTDRSSCTKGANGSSGSRRNALNDYVSPHASNPDCNYTNGMNGTSSAAPMVSGVIALMLEANADLNWREVKHILATEAVQVDASFSATAINGIDYVGWVTNAAEFKFHPWYGFGAVDATEAVNSAASFTAGSLGSESVTSWNDSSSESTTIDDLTSYTRNITESGSGTIEHVKVRISFDHSVPNSLGFRLQSPSGTVSTLLPPVTAIQNNPTTEVWVYLPSNAFYGETKAGLWTLEIIDHLSGTTGTFAQWGILFAYR